MSRNPDAAKGSQLVVLASVFVAIAALYFAQEVLVPIALAILLAFILGPLVTWLERVHIPRVPSVLIVVALTTCLFGFLTYTLLTQFVEVADRLPDYQSEIQKKLKQLRTPGKLTQTLENLQRTVEPTSQPATAPTSQPATLATSTAPATPGVRPANAWPGEGWPIAVTLTNITADNPLPVRLYSPASPARSCSMP